MRFLIIFTFALYFATGFLQAQSVPREHPLQTAIVSDTNCAVITYDPMYFWIFKDAKPATLSSDELRIVDSIYLYCKNDHRDELITTANYKRQYMPVVNSKGEKEVWVNCFCWGNENNWQKDIVMVMDGGNCFFNFRINLPQKWYYDFSVNGNG